MTAPAYEFERIPVVVQFDETAAFTETYGFAGSQGTVFLEGQRLVPRGRDSDTVLLFMHPASTLNLMPMPAALARAGFHILCCASRYAKNDAPLIMEKVVIPLRAGAFSRATPVSGVRAVFIRVGAAGDGAEPPAPGM